jgi:hypothetical protein
MHETLDPTDRLFVEHDLREPDRHELEHKRSAHESGRPSSTSIRARLGRRLIRLGSAIAAEPIDARQSQRPIRVRAS